MTPNAQPAPLSSFRSYPNKEVIAAFGPTRRIRVMRNDRLSRRLGTVPVGATIGLLTIMVFAAGFGVARLVFKPKPSLIATAQLTDFSVTLIEGATTITISDPSLEQPELARITVERHGDSITGIPSRSVQLPPAAELSPESQAFFRQELAGVISGSDSPARKADAIRRWLFNHSPNRNGPGLTTRDPREAYTQMMQGQAVLCGNLADIYVGLARAAGLKARTVSMSLMIRDDRFGADTHVAAEVWLPEFDGWVYQDPTFNCFWEVDGRPASAVVLHHALLAKQRIDRGPKNDPPTPTLQDYYVDPRLFFSHLYYEYQIGGALLYYLDEDTECINLRDQNWLQLDDDELFARGDLGQAEVELNQGEVAPGIFTQLINGKLFVRDRRPDGHGIRVRSSNGPVLACAYDHWQAGNLGVFDRINLVRNGSFQRAERSAQLADDWSVGGRVDGMTLAGGQGLGVGPGGRLFQRFSVEPKRSYVMYAKVSVTRGRVEWQLADAAGARRSSGSLEPGQIEEVLSDTVVSDANGQLEVGFTAPEGGGFRVLDVIVCEIPRGDDTADSLISLRRTPEH